MECPDCSAEMCGSRCKCGYQVPDLKRESPDPPKSKVRCFQCGAFVQRTGWCEDCQRFPSNVTPRRTDEQGHPALPDGFCFACKDFVLTGMRHTTRGWTDTGKVQTLIPTAEFKALMARTMAALDDVKSMPPSRPRHSIGAGGGLLQKEWAIVKERMAQKGKTP